ncbi:adenosylcobinamide-GDP ribazoletransferase, partial [Kitasatospora sp. NPDC007106]|uniref:adenosylcobinamide-GDP ribazoletransferase n=1 Tax=Kitasatospora sp. NPDC007106 TaxID=3156914 RepID=UPI0033ED3267
LLAAAGAGYGRQAWVWPAALVVGLGCAQLLLRRCVRRLDGITGDVLGATAETAATGALVALALIGTV